MTVTNATIDTLLQRRSESLDELTAQITPAIHGELRCAVELRKFSDGTRLSAEQLENCLQLVILYESRFLPENQRTGFDFPTSCKNQESTAARKTESGFVQFWGKDQA